MSRAGGGGQPGRCVCGDEGAEEGQVEKTEKKQPTRGYVVLERNISVEKRLFRGLLRRKKFLAAKRR